MKAKLTAKGQVTLPKAVRDRLGLAAGDQVKFFFHPDGHVVILPTIPITRLRGIASGYTREPVSIEDMDHAIASAVAEEYETSSSRT